MTRASIGITSMLGLLPLGMDDEALGCACAQSETAAAMPMDPLAPDSLG
jgi:hypothetical protein